jgi:hypothetical protein
MGTATSIDQWGMTKDRTAEFFSSVAVKQGNFAAVPQANAHHLNPRSPLLSPSPQPAGRHRHTEFTEAASQINTAIHSLLEKLEKLTKRKDDV